MNVMRNLNRAGPVAIAAALGVLLLLGLAQPWGAAGQTPAPLPIHFTENIGRSAVAPSPTALESALIAAINSAQTSIDAAIYDFNRVAVRDALLAAVARGVAVRVVTDDEARDKATFKPHYDALAAAGVPIVHDGGVTTATLGFEQAVALAAEGIAAPLTSGIAHNKYLILDGTSVWSGSTNLSDNDIGLNHNNALQITDPGVVAAFQNDFDQMFAGTFGTLKLPSPATTFTLTVPVSDTVVPTATLLEPVGLDVYFAPQDDPLNRIIEEVNAATTSIDFAIFFFTADDLRDALVAAHARGVAVRGIWDRLGSVNASSDDEALCAAGLSVRVVQGEGKMHNKLMVIDAAGSDPRVVTGSLNWTAGGTTINNENTLILHSDRLAAPYAAEFQRLWEQTAGAPCNPEPAPRTVDVRLPIIRNGLPDPTAPTPTPPPNAPPTATPTATPGATPSPTPTLTPTVAPGTVRIEKIVYDPPGDNLANERVEIRNPGGAPVNLVGWTLHDEAGATFTFPDAPLASGALLTVWVKAGTDGGGHFFWGRGSPTWNNDGDIATLRRPDASVASTCAYAGGGEEVLCEELLPEDG